MSTENVKIQPMYVYLGKDTYQVQKITCVPSTVAASLDGKYFLFQDAAGAKHYAWFDIGAAVDPAPAGGWTGHPVVVTEPASAAAVATALAAVLTAVSGFDATASGNVVTLTHTAYGFANPARNPDDVNKAGFAFQLETVGQVEVDAGCIDGDIEISGLQAETEDIKCHHTGTTSQGKLVKGYPPMEVTLTFNETAKENLKQAFIAAGHYPFLPVGAGAIDAFGYGPTLVGQQVPTIFMRLHPVSKDAADKTEDWNFWKAQALLDTFTFSGENISTIPLTFTIIPDKTKNKEIQFFLIGDGSQAGLGV